jgi:ceramide glucosyltransferase
MIHWALLALRCGLGLCLIGYSAYAFLSVWAARKWSQARPASSQDYAPAVTILKPVCGVDAEAWENFSSFCHLDYPGERVQILFGALEADDPALELARRLQVEFPQHDIGVITAPPGPMRGNNRKVCNLLTMLPHAKHDLFVLCDSDMRVRPDYLRRITAPFQFENPNAGAQGAPAIENPAVALVTCPYRGERAQSFAAIVEALGIGADFIPSTLVSRALEGVSFALGSTIVLPRRVLEEIGGFEPLLDELADDFRMGNAVHKAGHTVVLSDYVIESILGRERFSAMWSRRLRWSRTLRVCRPAGYAGSFIVYGFALALLFLVSTGFSTIGWAAFASVTAIRVATALTITLRYTGDRAVLRFLPFLPISDVLGLALFTVSFFGSHILWRGERFRLLAGGRLAREE